MAFTSATSAPSESQGELAGGHTKLVRSALMQTPPWPKREFFQRKKIVAHVCSSDNLSYMGIDRFSMEEAKIYWIDGDLVAYAFGGG